MAHLQFSSTLSRLDLLIEGAWTTLWISATSMVIALAIGLACAALMGLSRPLKYPLLSYIEVIRNTPFLVQLFVVYFGLLSIGLRLPPITAAIISLSIYGGAYLTEIIRAGIDNVPVGQVEAATVKHSSGEYVRENVHVNSTEGFNSRVRRTIAGVFHHISPRHADLYFHEIGFRWSQRIVTRSAVRTTRHGREIRQIHWSRVPPALQLLNVFRSVTGRQMRRSPDGGLVIKSTVAVFG